MSLPGLEITTPRLRLRPLRAADGAAFHAVYSDPEVMRYWSSPPVSDQAAAAALVAADLELQASGRATFWAVTLAGRDTAIGKCTLIDHDRGNRRAEIGFILAREHWGKGLMREACAGLLEAAFTEFGLHRIEADTDVENRASIALLERLGFQREGLFRERWRGPLGWHDSLMFGLLETDWHQRRPAPSGG